MMHLHFPLYALAHFIELAAVRTLGVVLGVVLACMGLAMGVTIVMLPVGIPLGLAGVLMILVAVSMPTDT